MTDTSSSPPKRRRLPKWLKVPLGGGPEYARLNGLVDSLELNTVCQSAKCPNRGECWSAGTATFMILGNLCTRGCRYCAVPKSKTPLPLDMSEPERVAEAVLKMNLRHAVITSVDRDDVADGGASVWAATIQAIREQAPKCAVEVLVPDFRNCTSEALETVLAAKPDIFNHNIETVPRLFPKARMGGDYAFSLSVLRRAKELAPDIPTKSGMMLGLGEEAHEIKQVLIDLRECGVELITMGQYLAPEQNAFYLPVDRFVTPLEFEQWAEYGRELGFRHVESAPLARSSYHAEKQANGERPNPVADEQAQEAE